MNARRGLQMILAAVMFAALVPMVSAEIADHVVISEVQIGGATAKDEFVELYNPTNSPISLEGWYLTKKTSNGDSDKNLLSGFPDKNISAHGFFLITPQTGYTGSVVADATYSQTTNSIAADNTVILYSDQKSTVIDKVGFGSATDCETAPYSSNPVDCKSIERKANETGVILGYGNAWDTDNNSDDFVLREVPNPQNSGGGSLPPLPEPVTLILISIGLVMLVCIASFKRLKNE